MRHLFRFLAAEAEKKGWRLCKWAPKGRFKYALHKDGRANLFAETLEDVRQLVEALP